MACAQSHPSPMLRRVWTASPAPQLVWQLDAATLRRIILEPRRWLFIQPFSVSRIAPDPLLRLGSAFRGPSCASIGLASAACPFNGTWPSLTAAPFPSPSNYFLLLPPSHFIFACHRRYQEVGQAKAADGFSSRRYLRALILFEVVQHGLK